MFGYKLIKKGRLEVLEDKAKRYDTLAREYYWFSDFPPVFKMLEYFVRHSDSKFVEFVRSEFRDEAEKFDWKSVRKM